MSGSYGSTQICRRLLRPQHRCAKNGKRKTVKVVRASLRGHIVIVAREWAPSTSTGRQERPTQRVQGRYRQSLCAQSPKSYYLLQQCHFWLAPVTGNPPPFGSPAGKGLLNITTATPGPGTCTSQPPAQARVWYSRCPVGWPSWLFCQV